MNIMLCPYCNNEVSDNSAFCQKCGGKIQQPCNTGQQTDPFDNQQTDQLNNSFSQYESRNNSYNRQSFQLPEIVTQPVNYGMVTAGLVMGILALACGGSPFGILGIIFSSIGMSQLKKNNAPTSRATTGLVLSIVGLVFWTIVYTVIVVLIAIGYLDFFDYLNWY